MERRIEMVEWFVPEFDEALPVQQRIATVELVWGGAGYKVQVVPFTNGDLPYAQLIARAPELQAETDRRLALLKRLEWIPDVDEEGLRYCSECGEYEENGHADGCELNVMVNHDN